MLILSGGKPSAWKVTLMTDISGEAMADLFTEWAKREGILSRITEDQCRDLAKAFTAGFAAAEAQRRQGLSGEEVVRRIRRMQEVAASPVGDWPRILAGKDAEIARLQAEIDDLREVPVEYVPEAGLHAAMTADPGREDGTILRETNGRKRAFEWKAAAKTWEQVR